MSSGGRARKRLRVSAFGPKRTFGADIHHAAKGPYDPAALIAVQR